MGGLNAFQWMLKERKVGPKDGAALWKAMDDQVPGRAICSTYFSRIHFSSFFLQLVMWTDLWCGISQSISNYPSHYMSDRKNFFLFCLHYRLYMSDPSPCTKYFREEGLTRKCEKGIVQFGLQGQGWVQREGKSREREKNKPLSQALRFAAEESEHKSFIWLGPKTWDSHHIVYRPDTRGRHCRNLRIFQLFPFSSNNKQVFRP